MFTPNFIREGLKTKVEAIKRVLECLVQNPACAGLDGTLPCMWGGTLYTVKPIKKKKNEEK